MSRGRDGADGSTRDVWATNTSTDPPPLMDDATGLVVRRSPAAWSPVGADIEGRISRSESVDRTNDVGEKGTMLSNSDGRRNSEGRSVRGGPPTPQPNAWAGKPNVAEADMSEPVSEDAPSSQNGEWARTGSKESKPVAWSEGTSTTNLTMSTNARPFQPRSRVKDQNKAAGRTNGPAPLNLGDVAGPSSAAASADATTEPEHYVYSDGNVPFAYRPYVPMTPTSPYLIPNNAGQFGFHTHAFPPGQYAHPALASGGGRSGYYVGAPTYGVVGGQQKFGRGYQPHSGRGRAGGGNRRKGEKQNTTFVPEVPMHDLMGFYPFAALGGESRGRRKGRGSSARRSRQNQARTTPQSKILEDLHLSSESALELKDIIGHVVEFATDQHGSRYLQHRLDTANEDTKSAIFAEVLPATIDLTTDIFGNYVVQKFFQHGTHEQHRALMEAIKGNVLALSLQMYGCRVLQKALETMSSEDHREIIEELRTRISVCVRDKNGNHVIQKCVEHLKTEIRQPIIDVFKGEAAALAKHPYGCRVIQRVLDFCPAEQKADLRLELLEDTDALVKDQYGNYVIQHMLEKAHEMGTPEDVTKIASGVQGNILTLSQHKFASNVIEKCVIHANPEIRAAMIDEVCKQTTNVGVPALETPGSTRFLKATALDIMIRDQFANYVIQRMLTVGVPAERSRLISLIAPQLEDLRAFPYGKHIVAKIEELTEEKNEDKNEDKIEDKNEERAEKK